MTSSTVAGIDLMELAGRVEAADAAESREWLEQAFYALNPAPECATPERVAWAALSNRFHALVRVQAFLDAAMTLIPVDEMRLLDIELGFEPPHTNVWPAASVRWYPPRKEGKDWHAMVVTAATLPLTITAAALRARSSLIEEERS